MGHAFASQNELGRLCDECAYQSDLKARLSADGFHSVYTEVPVTVTHRDFAKRYYLDLVADDSLYELKANATLVGENDAQLLNYVLLLGIRRGKLLNFRPPRVQGRIVASSLTPEERRQFIISVDEWEDFGPACNALRQTMCDLLSDWGAFLDLALYQEALVYFLGGEDRAGLPVKLSRNGMQLGTQRMLSHADGLAFRLTAFTKDGDSIAQNLRRLLALTDFKAIQWINLNHSRIEFTTITR